MTNKDKRNSDELTEKKLGFDFLKSVLALVNQIPKGRVSSYKEIAIALGDEIAARAVGEVLGLNPYPVVIPCHRVVHSNGMLGGYSLGVEKKKRLLEEEGVEVENSIIKNFDGLIYRDFKTEFPLKRFRMIQEEARKKILLEDLFECSDVSGFDVAYHEDRGFGALVSFSGSLISKFFVEKKINFPYIPSYLGFREFPLALDLIKKIKKTTKTIKFILMVDGNGILHPRRMGSASFIGVMLDIPTIGVAKKLFCGEIKNNEIFIDDELVGYKIGGVYVSPGHKITAQTSAEIVKKYIKFKVPEPIRLAHRYANEIKTLKLLKNF